MKTTKSYFLNKTFFVFCLFSFCNSTSSRGTVQALMTFTNFVQTNANTFEYDVFATNTGTDSFSLRGYSWGLNMTTGIANGGIISHVFLCRDSIFNDLPPITSTFTAVNHHLRATTVTAPAGFEVNLVFGVPYRVARMRVHTTATSWPTNANPFTPTLPFQPIQTIVQSGFTQCILSVFLTPPTTGFSIIGPANTPSALYILGLSTIMIPDPYGPTPFLLNCSTCPISTPVSACGSYTWPVSGQTYTQSGIYTQTFVIPGTTGCLISSSINLTITTNTFSNTSLIACDSITFNGQTYTNSVSFIDTITNSVGCDSIITVNISIGHASSETISQTNCNSVTINSQTYTNTGTYIQNLTNVAGCDSVLTINLIINQSTSSNITAIACNAYTLNSVVYTTSGAYTQTIVNAAGCDSTITLNLLINQATNSTLNQNACNAFVWNAQTYTNTGVYTKTFTNSVGCDSFAHLNLIIHNTQFITVNQNACNSFTWNTQTYTNSGTHTNTFTNIFSCDSIVTLNLTIFQNTFSTSNQSACDSYTWNGVTYTFSGVYTITLINSAGCDSIATLSVNIINSTTTFLSKTACNSYTLNSQTYFTSGNYTQQFINSIGCDSLVQLSLIINPSKTTNINQVTCNSFPWNGQLITTTGTYSQAFLSAEGCDSTVILNATIKSTSTSTINPVACNSFTLGGQTYTQSGNYSQTLSNSIGCDSVINMVLQINPISKLEQEINLCYGKQFIINNHIYTESGTYVDTLLKAFTGCDSIVTTRLNVEKSKNGGDFIANAFSPNGDGKNDCFGISYWKDIKEIKFLIYNRWGNQVFSTDQIWNCWNGNYKGAPAESDTYYYYIKTKTSCGEKSYKGDILLLR